MQIPDALLSARLPAAAKTVLAALWRHADGEPPWTAPKVVDLAAAVGMSVSHVKSMLALLAERGAVRREVRETAGRQLRGFGLCRSVTPVRQRRPLRRPSAPTTPPDQTKGVADREVTHKPTIQDDLVALARVAGRGDSEKRIAEALVRRKVPCSDGQWHHVKVHRRVALMRQELGLTSSGLRAGDIVVRWKAVAEAQGRRQAATSR